MIRLLKKAARKGLSQVDRVHAAVNMAKLEKNVGPDGQFLEVFISRKPDEQQ